MGKILLKNCRYVVTQNEKREVLENASILINENKIEKIIKEKQTEGNNKNKETQANEENNEKQVQKSNEEIEVIDCSDFAAMPGLINMHTHASMNLLKGMVEDLPFFEWLQKLWKVEPKLTRKDMYEGALLACREMIRTGTTTFNDMYFNLEETAKAVHETGMRAFLGWAVIDADKTSQEGITTQNAINFIEKFKNDELVKPTVAPHAIYSVQPELYKESKKIADRYNTFLHTHAAETRKEVADCYKNYGKRVIELFDEIGILDENTCLAHVGWITKKEARIIADKKATVILNPTSNMKLGTGGNPPLPEMLEYGVNVTIGTDSTVSNNSLDLFEAMKYTALLQKHMRWDSGVIKAQDVLDFATINAAKFLKLNAGSIEEGKLADVILIDLKEPVMQPVNDIVANIVYSANGNCVDTTIINGKILMRNKKVLV